MTVTYFKNKLFILLFKGDLSYLLLHLFSPYYIFYNQIA